jgi:uncharacterized membrane-anchored protein
MQIAHIPKVNARYWSAILLASLCGTNTGDLYAHEAHLGIILGTAILAVLAAVVFLLERRDHAPRELYYWTVILIIRTGATNIADYFKHIIPWVVFGAILTAMLAGFAWLSKRGDAKREAEAEALGMPNTGTAYWAAMLSAGIFGTFVGDVASKLIGKGAASLALGALLLVALAIWRRDGVHRFWMYWIALAVARTAGTAMGDWLAETKELGIGLPLSTLITATIFILILVLWPRQGGDARPIPQTA